MMQLNLGIHSYRQEATEEKLLSYITDESNLSDSRNWSTKSKIQSHSSVLDISTSYVCKELFVCM